MTSLSSLIAPYKKVPLIGYNRVLMDMSLPVGQSGSYIPSITDFSVKENGLTLLSAATYTIDTNGYAYHASPNSLFVGFDVVPAKVTSIRKYELWGKTKNAALTENTGVQIQFNRLDGANHWNLYLKWSAGSQSIFFGQLIAGVWNSRGTPAALPAAINVPMHFHLTCFDLGDTVIGQCIAFEEDSAADIGAAVTYYTVGSRTNKTEVKTRFWNIDSAGGDSFLLRGCKVSDI